ncbi:hypothetical protein GPECTOR_16g756 [Gonium pectorale]|uniref:Uncharacterized protein n=1 Tax=Gonium pectorale TaxID=33097 RepID=A0A150GLA8_GONPE|nr:hypothetical protein GPECTOR_16g756 [Gonium pectorale]|eukprot:KXZ50581.1 hypothetical protein GPECTOR_16g756 [Gonium pectorale]
MLGGVLLRQAQIDYRGHNIAAVEAAYSRWNDSSNPDGWEQFMNLEVTAILTPDPAAKPLNVTCRSMTLPLRQEFWTADYYKDEVFRFLIDRQQMRLRAGVPYDLFTQCRMQVTLLQQPPNATEFAPLAVIPSFSTVSSYSVDVYAASEGQLTCVRTHEDCSGRAHAGCRFDCEAVRFMDVAIKVSYGLPAMDGKVYGYGPDYTNPAPGMGGNVLPAGFNSTDPPSNNTRFQVINVPEGLWKPVNDSQVTITVRSSADPFLAYWEVTRGTGRFGMFRKAQLNKAGLALLVVGLVIEVLCLVTLLICYIRARRGRRGNAKTGGAGGETLLDSAAADSAADSALPFGVTSVFVVRDEDEVAQAPSTDSAAAAATVSPVALLPPRHRNPDASSGGGAAAAAAPGGSVEMVLGAVAQPLYASAPSSAATGGAPPAKQQKKAKKAQ